MIINIAYDLSVNSAPAGFKTAVAAVVQFFQSHFLDPVTININVGYGEVANQVLGSGVLGESLTYFNSYSYSQIKNALALDAKTADDNSAITSVPTSDPISGSHAYWVATADAKALGLFSSTSNIDGYVGFSSSANIFDYDNSNGVTAGQYDFYGVVAHEISEVMGRQMMTGEFFAGTTAYEPLDLFHYSSPGQRIFSGTTAGYFSIDGGQTNLDSFNTNSNGDFGDWAASAGNDAFLAFIPSGVVNAITATDLKAMDILGWDANSPPVISANLPQVLQHDVVIQNDTTGQVDYLKYFGTTLVASDLKDYGLGSVWKIVASDIINGDGFPDLVAQNQTTSQIDFLFLNANGDLIGSALGSSVPRIVGVGFHFGTVPGQAGHTMVSQLPDGQLDMLGFNSAAQLIASDLVPGTKGLPHAVGVAAGNASAQALSGLGNQDAVVTQLADGSVDFIGFTGSFSNASLAYVASFLVPGSAGTPAIGAVNQNIGVNFNERDAATGTEGIHTITQLPNGQLDAVLFDSGINNTANMGREYASTLFDLSLPGWHLVDGGLVAQSLFPIV